jgi:hypothetical protein
MRIATLHGILYLLQSAVLANCEETMNAVHPLTIEYIQRYIDVQDSSRYKLSLIYLFIKIRLEA